MSEPVSAGDSGSGTATPSVAAPSPAPSERGWVKLILALVAFIALPRMVPQVGAILPIDQPVLLLVPALAACALVGWWAGGRAFLALAWVAIAVLLAARQSGTPDPFNNLARGWSLLLAGSFGLVCLFSMRRPLFARSMIALGVTLSLALVMSLLGPVTMSQATKTIGDEFGRRNHEAIRLLDSAVASNPDLQQAIAKVPMLANYHGEDLTVISGAGVIVFPAVLALESLAALALAWATYHRFSRARLGAPLKPLREFRFNDQLVWGLIVGLTIMLLPTLTALSGVGKNLLVFFGALYALRGLGVLSWFMAPGALAVTVGVGLLTLIVPVINVVAALGFVMLGIAAMALGLGDTWADWRGRARTTPL